MEKNFFNGYFFEPLLFELRAAKTGKDRKKLLYKSLNILLCNYLHNCSVSETVKQKGKEAHYCLSSNLTDIDLDKHLNRLIKNTVHMTLSHDGDRGELMHPLIFKLLCLIIALNTSDRDANAKFRELAEELAINWHKELPNWVAIRCLKKVEPNFLSELKLLEKYDFSN